ncbi:hypothetical protein GWI33_003745 [Rhynchophorus ferrugineus]|uniref:Uncharacterized protein n=1 Tax=Rhynchophorus ferrugineus TaxID=354439 RepID=A0A834M0W8_RHYFE|nr:hypothetical protein GWI33_003745 [Rhynchophorus ferrugineus]
MFIVLEPSGPGKKNGWQKRRQFDERLSANAHRRHSREFPPSSRHGRPISNEYVRRTRASDRFPAIEPLRNAGKSMEMMTANFLTASCHPHLTSNDAMDTSDIFYGLRKRIIAE